MASPTESAFDQPREVVPRLAATPGATIWPSTWLVVTYGPPGCGKSTLAQAWVEANPAGRARISRDDLRDMMHPVQDYGAAWQENMITTVQLAAVEALLRDGAAGIGARVDVVVDDTNIVLDPALAPDTYMRQVARLARRYGAGVELWDMSGVPLDTCLARNKARTVGRVPAEAVRAMAAAAVGGRPAVAALADRVTPQGEP